MRLHGPDDPVYTIGVASRLLGVSTQTIRILDREGLITPSRTNANIRLYSENDLLLLKRITTLVRRDRVNIAGVKLILEMESSSSKSSLSITHLSVSQRTEDEDVVASDDESFDAFFSKV